MKNLMRIMGLCAAFLAGSGPAQAGSRTAEIVAVALDDGSDSGSKACGRKVVAGVLGGDATVRWVKRADFLKRIEQADGAGLLGWTGAQFEKGAGPLRDDQLLDAVLAIDCRPAAGVLRVVLVNAQDFAAGKDPTVRFETRGAVNPARLALLLRLLPELVWRDMNY